VGAKLASFCREKLRTHFSQDVWARPLQEYLGKQKLEKSLVKSHLQHCLDNPCETFWDEVSLLQNFSTIILFTRSYSFAFQDLFLECRDEFFRKIRFSHPLTILLQALVDELLHLPTNLKEDKKRSIISRGTLFIPDQVRLPIPKIECQIAALAALLGILQKDQELIDHAATMAETLTADWQNADCPFLSLWSKSSEFNSSEILLSYYLMLVSVEHFEKGALLFQRYISEGDHFQAPVFFTLLEDFFYELKTEKISAKPNSLLKTIHHNPNKAAAYFMEPKWQVALTMQGMNTSMGALRGGGVEITAFGPQFSPLSSSEGFGICRPAGFEESQFQEREGSFTFNAWSNLTADGRVKRDAWIGLKAEVSSGKCLLKFSVPDPVSEKYAVSFYVKAKNCSADQNKPLLRKSLSGFTGRAKKVFCRGEGELLIEPNQETFVHIIPLAGKGFFWDADFLVAFEMDSLSKDIQINSLSGSLS
jgi:hypothetical protein